MTRPVTQSQQAKELLDTGVSQVETARRLGIPSSTLVTWVQNGFEYKKPASEPCEGVHTIADEEAYAYLLGLYLGDGCLSEHARGVYHLRITLDLKYPNLIAECRAAIAAVHPAPVGMVPKVGCVEVSAYWKHWPCLFPQHGVGMKHTRPIVLAEWQHQLAVVEQPKLLLRGLIHSDGWRGTNVAITRGQRYHYPRYQFSNRSDDIRNIFRAACAQLGISCKQANRWNLAVSRKLDVAYMDSFIGPKT